MRMTKSEFQRLVKTLEGKKMARIHYFESDFGVPGPDWTRDPRFDSVGQGIDLEMETGEIYALMWDNTFFCYGVGLWERSMETGLRGGFNKWDVSGNSRWKPLLLEYISRVDVDWDDGFSGIVYPQSISFTFETGDVVHISAMEITDQYVNYFHSHITVIFDDAVARQYQVGPYAPVTGTMH